MGFRMIVESSTVTVFYGVLPWRDYPQVMGVDAILHPADMVDIHTFWYRPLTMFVYEPMGRNVFPIDIEPSISESAHQAGPEDTIRILPNIYPDKESI